MKLVPVPIGTGSKNLDPILVLVGTGFRIFGISPRNGYLVLNFVLFCSILFYLNFCLVVVTL